MSDKPAKLTKPQAEMLQEFASGRRTASSSYPPVVKLLSLGLITKVPTNFSEMFDLTPAGLAHPVIAEARRQTSETTHD